MDYEQKYAKALWKMEELYNRVRYMSNPEALSVSQTLEDTFPELKESEDERIRKDIIRYIKKTSPAMGENIENMVAWLEKQGEKTNPYSGISFEYNGHIWGMCAREGGVDILCDSQLTKHVEKQGEQKPADKVEPKFRVGDTIHRIGENTVFPRTIEKIEDGEYVCNNSHLFVNIKFQDDYELVEQKPVELNREDEWHINNIISLLEQARDRFVKESNGQYPAWITNITWLKSLKDRVQPQPKQEWSKEDEKMWSQVINEIEAIKSNSSTIFEKNIAQDKIDWLKSLKPQKHWKPSEEQMKALNAAINLFGEFPYVGQGGLLVTLYQDLKKL